MSDANCKFLFVAVQCDGANTAAPRGPLRTLSASSWTPFAHHLPPSPMDLSLFNNPLQPQNNSDMDLSDSDDALSDPSDGGQPGHATAPLRDSDQDADADADGEFIDPVSDDEQDHISVGRSFHVGASAIDEANANPDLYGLRRSVSGSFCPKYPVSQTLHGGSEQVLKAIW